MDSARSVEHCIGSGPFGGRFSLPGKIGVMQCSVNHCDRPVLARGWCNRHYRRWKRHGDPTASPSKHRSVHERFWTRVDRYGPDAGEDLGRCWVWRGKPDAHGYGKISVRPGRGSPDEFAHRFAYRYLVGPCPPGLELDHLCRNRICVKPWHLEPVTHIENVRRGDAVSTHCPQGHAYDEANTYRRPDGSKVCRQCARANARKNYHLRKSRQS